VGPLLFRLEMLTLKMFIVRSERWGRSLGVDKDLPQFDGGFSSAAIEFI
jgi:hypothetical protein